VRSLAPTLTWSKDKAEQARDVNREPVLVILMRGSD
jgi:hypothetical protein